MQKIHFQLQKDGPKQQAGLKKLKRILESKAISAYQTKSVTFKTAHGKSICLIKNDGKFKIQNRDKGPPRVRDPERFRKISSYQFFKYSFKSFIA